MKHYKGYQIQKMFLPQVLCLCLSSDKCWLVHCLSYFSSQCLSCPRWLLDFFFLVTGIFFLLQLETLNFHMSKFLTFKVDDLVAFFLVFLLESCVLSSGGMLELSFLFQHMLEFSRHESHFLIYGSSKIVVWTITNLTLNPCIIFGYLLKSPFGG